MSLNTNLSGRLRNTDLPKSNALFPLFEAVINSIHSLDDRAKKDKTDFSPKIKIIIKRDGQRKLDSKEQADISGFEIIDNGEGFNQDNINSFKTLDSDFKIQKGCRGIGRLLWLKEFQSVNVISVYREDDGRKKVTFDFTVKNDIHNEEVVEANQIDPIETCVHLNSLSSDYLKYIPKSAESIALHLLEHCLWYFLREGGVPEISIIDGTDTIDLNSLHERYMLDSAKPDSISIKSHQFDITHVKLKSRSQNKHSIFYSAGDRVVKEESLSGKIPGLFGTLNDGTDDFTYMCFVSSPFLTEMVRPERYDFKIPENHEGLFEDSELSFKEIRQEVVRLVAEYLDGYLSENKKKGEKRLTDYIDTKAPRYRPIMSRIPDNERIVDPGISDKDLEVKLHSHLVDLERELLVEGHELMGSGDNEDESEYARQVEEYLSKASDLKQSDLANYVAHRRVIIDLLSKAIKIGKDGKYQKEEVLHKFLMPMQVDSDAIVPGESNLWLIDESLSFHNYLASDKTLKSMPISLDDNTTKEPDLLALNVYDNPLLVNDGGSLPLASITVIEIKRPMRNDAKAGEEKDPIEQALGYLNRVRNGKVTTSQGRPIPNSEDIPGFCYVISDITDSVKNRCNLLDLQVTSDKMGYFGYHKTFKAYIEVISFDRLVNMATERNRAFFDKLGLPSS